MLALTNYSKDLYSIKLGSQFLPLNFTKPSITPMRRPTYLRSGTPNLQVSTKRLNQASILGSVVVIQTVSLG